MSIKHLVLSTFFVCFLAPFQKSFGQLYKFGGKTYATVGQSESVYAPFNSEGGTTTEEYSGLVLITVSGTGTSAGTTLNDAFYLFSDGIGHEENYYQLQISPNGFSPANPSMNAKNFIVFDANAQRNTSQPYIPAYSASHTYSFVIDMQLINQSNASQLTFGVNDGIYYDNSGSYNVQVTQLYDISCGNNGDKVSICQNGKQICVSVDAVPALLKQGASLSPCR